MRLVEPQKRLEREGERGGREKRGRGGGSDATGKSIEGVFKGERTERFRRTSEYQLPDPMLLC
jgi:hypothetical protein